LGFALLGAAVGWVLWLLLRPTLTEPVFRRPNYRGRPLTAVGGLPLPLAAVAVTAGYWVVRPSERFDNRVAVAAVAIGLGFGFLGLLDDVAGNYRQRGFRGHLGALAEGTVTTGLLKLVGGLAVAAVAVAGLADTWVGYLRDTALVALAANVGNLFDRAPGRCIKVLTVAFAVTAALGLAVGRAGIDGALKWPAIAVGAALALVVFDLREQLMLGDTGANVLGASVGLSVVLAGSSGVRWLVLALVVGLNGAGELVSFSTVIERVAPLRILDRLGRLPLDLE
jgi:UDP-GlcNAc:undecaprenyl-phosphate GlcNAc-1-phosphate transferase